MQIWGAQGLQLLGVRVSGAPGALNMPVSVLFSSCVHSGSLRSRCPDGMRCAGDFLGQMPVKENEKGAGASRDT